MRKKWFAGTLAAMMSMTLVLPVYAEEKTTNLTAEVASSYILTIPQATTLTFGKMSNELDGVLKVAGNVRTTETVEVTAETKPLKIEGGTETLAYELKNGEAAFTNATWNESELRDGLASEAAGKSLTLSVAIDETVWNNAKAGTYNGGIVFKAEQK